MAEASDAGTSERPAATAVPPRPGRGVSRDRDAGREGGAPGSFVAGGGDAANASRDSTSARHPPTVERPSSVARR
jgi:hypothetical protein